MAITSFTPGFQIGTINTPKIDFTKGLSLGASNKVSLSNSLGDLNIKPKIGLNLLGNINMGLLATMALPMITGALKSAADKPLQNMTSEQRLLFEAIYGSGDSVLGDLFSMKQNVQNSIDNINSNIHTNTGALGSILALADSFNNINFDAFKLNNDKINFGQGLSRIADSAVKGFSAGMATGNPLVGGILAAANAIGSGARMTFAGKNRNAINNAAELALNKTIDNLYLLAENTQKQINLMNLANANMYALGGQLNYNIDDKYLANDYMSKLNSRIYKPLFDSMNYFAMGGSPDFTEFNTGGTHEENSLGGIPVKQHIDGSVSAVEQDETMTKTPNGDYIFSNRLKLSNEECKTLKVPIGSTYAEASKILKKEYDENPNDEIARKGWELFRDILIQSLEMLKQEIALKEAKKQGLNSPKMLGIDHQVMQDMYYNENPQEEDSLQQGINPNILNAFGGIIKKFKDGGISESFKYAPIAGNLIGLSQNLFTPEDYSLPNRLQQEINELPRVSVPKNTNYMTYNPVDVNRYTNQYNANATAQRNAIMNTSNPSKNAALATAMYNANIGYGDLVQAIEAQNAKERQAVQQFDAGIDQLNIANQLQVDGINQQYEQMRIKGIMQELDMRDAIQTARANAIQGNLKGLTDNLSGIAQLAQNDRWFNVYMAGLPHELTMLQRLANGEDINDLIMEFTPGYLDNERTEFIKNLKKNPRYKDYISQIIIK